MSSGRLWLVSITVTLVVASGLGGWQGAASAPAQAPEGPRLFPTDHPPLPAQESHYWIAPAETPPLPAAQRFARGAGLIAAGDFAAGLPLVSSSEVADSPLGVYAAFYRAAALAGLSRFDEAASALRAAGARRPNGYLEVALPRRVADVALAAKDPARAVAALDALIGGTLLSPEAVWLQLAQASELAGDSDRALAAYRTLYYDFPTSAEAAEAQAAMARMRAADRPLPDRYGLELRRAQALFDAGRWSPARTAFELVAPAATGADAALVAVRLAECDYRLNRFRQAREALRPYLTHPTLGAEAQYFSLSATRAIGDRPAYVALVRLLVDDHPESRWTAEGLNDLASHHITSDDDREADRVFRDLLRLFPANRHAERAAWKVGWRAYRSGDFRTATETFDRAAAAFPRADYRPSWLYWSARARTELNEPSRASERHAIVIADYQNSYYGRLSLRAVEAPRDPARRASAVVEASAPAPSPLPAEGLIRDLLALQLYDDALLEVQYAQRVGGDSPRLQATAALIRHTQGLGLTGQERFNAVRGAITTMRRAYPQFMAAGGEQLPPDVLRVIFPLDYWGLITKYATAHDLDPYLLAALMAQESTFTAEVRSSANAIGLMQLIPATGRRMAQKLGVRNFTTRALTQPELNVRLGTRYFKDLLLQFGQIHYALAGYNAGESRVERWLTERGPLPADEFIDDIPFPETQLYVKRILGTAEDYRRLYGGGLLDPNVPLAARFTIASAPRGGTVVTNATR
jgi:soluble lytic murein transglycosylase